ncbi:MAG: cytochrome c-type biogenesis protein CcmH [Gammaproteobacteria bacterium]|nr:cytochrome c-type biogenesis protein CcmH [Gammaproteobacteria bacterium]
MLLIVLVSLTFSVAQSIDGFVFEQESERKRFGRLIEEFRCPQCVNTNLAGSDAPIAQDLRRTVFSLMREGKSDQEIRNYLRERYGDFILFKPRFTPGTWALWGTPIVLLLLATWFLMGIREKRKAITLNLRDIQRVQEISGERQ